MLIYIYIYFKFNQFSVVYTLHASISDRRLRPGPPAKLAAANPMRCFASCIPEKPRANPKSTVRFELKYKQEVNYEEIKVENLKKLAEHERAPILDC